MSHKVWIQRLSFKFRSHTRWRVVAILTFGLLSVAGIRESSAVANSQLASAQAQDQSFETAQSKFEEGQALLAQGAAESLRMAVKKFEEALSIMRGKGVREGALLTQQAERVSELEAKTLVNIGDIYDSLGEKQKALDFYSQSLPILRSLNKYAEEATALNNIGYVYYSMGESQKALDFFLQSLPILRAAGQHVEEAITLNNIGMVYKTLGELQKALDFYSQSLPILRAAGQHVEEAKMINNIGLLYFSLGEKQKALDFLNQALQMWVTFNEPRERARTLTSIGGVYNDLGEWQKALDIFNQALPILRVVNDRSGEAVTLNNIGYAYDSLGEKQKALDSFNQALPLFRAVNDRSGEAGTLNNIGKVYYSTGELQKALDFFNQSLQLLSSVGDRPGPLSNIARIKRDLGQFDESRSYIESAIKIIESVRASIISKELRASYFATEQDIYEFYIDLLMQMRGREPGRGHDAEALQASERARARSLLENLIEARADIRRGVDPELLARERATQQRINTKAEEELKLLANKVDETRLAAHRREMDALTVELQEVRTQIRKNNPRYDALAQPQPLTLSEIQRQALDDDTLLLEYSLGKDRSYLWAVTPATINSYELPKREVIEAAARRVHELLSKSGGRGQGAKPKYVRLKKAGGEYLAAASDLSRTLLGPVAGQLGKKRLLIVADGALHYVPFSALPDPSSPKEGKGRWQPLVVEHEVVNLPSASTIAVLRRELAGRIPAARTLAVLADPVFSKSDVRIKLGARRKPGARRDAPQTAQFNSLDESRAKRLVEAAGGARGDLDFARLPGTRLEAKITAFAPLNEIMKALGFKANRATATSDQLGQYRYVHFATHGLADSERPELSTILLSRYDEQGRPQDGFLRAHEIYNLNLPAEMVALSACQTGLGKLTRGEGLVSLTRGFMYAGAARVVVSLWNVDDEATAELMMKLYRRVLVKGERPAAALRAAQVEMWRKERWKAPDYWAAFTLQGEWR